MRLYVWEGVFSDYSAGMAVALANSLQEAKDAVAEEYNDGFGHTGKKECACYSCRELCAEKLQVYATNRKKAVAFQVSGGG